MGCGHNSQVGWLYDTPMENCLCPKYFCILISPWSDQSSKKCLWFLIWQIDSSILLTPFPPSLYYLVSILVICRSCPKRQMMSNFSMSWLIDLTIRYVDSRFVVISLGILWGSENSELEFQFFFYKIGISVKKLKSVSFIVN